MRKVLLLTVMCLALIGSAWAQQKVTGNVTGDDGSGIPGVTVFEVGTSNGVIKDSASRGFGNELRQQPADFRY